MKLVLTLMLLLSPALVGQCLTRSNAPALTLHSVFDARHHQLPVAILNGDHTMAFNTGALSSPYRGEGNNKQSAGITLLVLGVLCFGAAALCFNAADRQSKESIATHGSGSAGMGYDLLGIAAMGAGTGLVIPGMILTIKYSAHHGKQRWW